MLPMISETMQDRPLLLWIINRKSCTRSKRFFERQNSMGLILGRSSYVCQYRLTYRAAKFCMVTNVGERCVSMVNHAPRLKGRAQSIPIFATLRTMPPRNWRGRDNSAVNFGELLYICLRPRRMPQRNQLLRGYQTRWEVTFYRVLHAPWPKRRISKNIFMTAIPVWRIRMLLRNLYACGS